MMRMKKSKERGRDEYLLFIIIIIVIGTPQHNAVIRHQNLIYFLFSSASIVVLECRD